jgi:excisionase family DNA binding protein
MATETDIQPDLTIEQVACYFSCSKVMVHKLINCNVIKAYKVGRATRIRRESVEAIRGGGVRPPKLSVVKA